jgi:hypothetical protein
LPAEPPALKEIRRVVQIFRELRSGLTDDGKTKLKSPTSTLSTAEAISVMNSGMALAGHFGDGALKAADLASGLLGAVVKDPGTGQHRLAGISGDRGERTRRLARSVSGLPRVGLNGGVHEHGASFRHPPSRPRLRPELGQSAGGIAARLPAD